MPVVAWIDPAFLLISDELYHYATLAGAIAGALHDMSAIPSDWRDTVEAANPEPDMHALSLGLAKAAQQRQQKMQAVTAAVDQLLNH